MTVLYWDCFSGIAGNMAVASLLDLGASLEKLEKGLKSIPFSEGPIELIAEEKLVDGIRGVYFNTRDDEDAHSHSPEGACHDYHDHTHTLEEHPHTHCHEDHHIGDTQELISGHTHCELINHGSKKENPHHSHAPNRGLKEIQELISKADISPRARQISIDCFNILAGAEAEIHGKSIEDVHFHEVGARDSIADIVGVAICLDDLDVWKVKVSPVHLGSGMIECAHGRIPVPAPATALLLRGLPVVFDHNVAFELTTPTGAAILKAVEAEPALDCQFVFDKVGHGHGSRKIGQANFLRAFLKESDMVKKNSDSIVLFESNLDNATGEILGAAAEELLRLGALDVCLIPLVMKKGRPGHQLQVQSRLADADHIERALFDMLPTLGVRKSFVERTTLFREKTILKTEFGDLVGKKIHEADGSINEKIEFEELKRIAREQGTSPLKIIYKIGQKIV